MDCTRCGKQDVPLAKSGWCKECEHAYDGWVRRHATDVLWSVMAGGIVLCIVGVALPILGVATVFVAVAPVACFGTMLGLYRSTQRRRRRQFLSGNALPRAYLPAPK